MKSTWLYGISAAAIAVGAMATIPQQASAATIQQLLTQHPEFVWEDDNFENEIDGAGDPGTLSVGDRLRGVVVFPTFVDVGTGDQFDLDGVANSNLTAIFEVEVTSKTAVGGGLFNYTFGASSDFGTETGIAGAAVQFFEDTGAFDASDLRTAPSVAAAEGLVTDGTLILTLGFGDDPDNHWLAFNAPDNLAFVDGFNNNVTLGSFNFGLDVLGSTVGEFAENGSVTPFGNVTFAGSGTVQGGANAPQFTVESDTDIGALFIPVPASLGILAAGLVLLGAAARHRRLQAV